MAARRDIHVFVGASEVQTVTFTATQAAYTFAATLSDDTEFTVTQLANVVTATLTADQTALLTKPLYSWTLWRTAGTTVEALISGNVIVSR